MPILKHAIKKVRVDERRAQVNKRVRTQMKRAVKQLKSEPSQDTLTATFSAIDRAAKKQVIHPGKANRLKSRLSRLLSK